MILKYLLILLLPLTCAVLSQLLDDRFSASVCSANAGCLKGRLMHAHNITEFEAFLGIPYALPPVGELRFSSPVEYPKWKDTLNAFEAKPDCIQKNYLLPTHPISGSEDCLYLNVYRPQNVSSFNKLPVMVYIHGGGWFSGSANPVIIGPEYIMETEHIILVTFSYRLGAFGFLSTGDTSIPGNFGLKDQLLALKWVQQNIESFGGDPKKVTIFGQSAGAVSAHMHMLSRKSQGLFHGVIAFSGTANVPFAITKKPLEQAIQTAKLSGIKNANNMTTLELLEALRNVNVYTLLKAGDGLKFWDVDHITNYRPVIEAPEVKDAFFTEHPVDIMKRGDYQAVPLMLGTVPNEGAVRVVAIMESGELKNSFNQNFYNTLQTFLEFPSHFDNKTVSKKMSKIIKKYFNGEQQLNDTTTKGFMDLVTDRGFHHGFYNTIKNFVHTIDTKLTPIFLYVFNYTGPYTFSTVYSGGPPSKDYGIVHCDDLIYLFRSPVLFPDFTIDSHHVKAVQLHIKNVVHFAKYLQPLPDVPLKKCNKLNFNRKPETICDYHLLENYSQSNSSPVLKTDNRFNVSRMKFWNDILSD